jgi:2-succinyl-6-hydroxy-2,4-cyclohexadiene-1-carboxylate synthase
MSTCVATPLKNGSGIPLVFLHGFLGTHRDWIPVCSDLPHWPCIGIDLPGHGASPFCETLSFIPPAPKFHLIGYSMGGRLAMQYALDHPDQIGRLIIASAHPGLPSQREKEKRIQADTQWALLLHQLPIDEFLRRWYDQPVFGSYKPDFSMRREQNISGLSSALVHYSLGHQPMLKVAKALHVVGEKDRKFRALHPNALVVPNAGHVVHLEHPKAFAQIIREHL